MCVKGEGEGGCVIGPMHCTQTLHTHTHDLPLLHHLSPLTSFSPPSLSPLPFSLPFFPLSPPLPPSLPSSSTWVGPSWSAAQSLLSVLLSVQSLMSEKPYHNEPGFEHVCNTQQRSFIIKYTSISPFEYISRTSRQAQNQVSTTYRTFFNKAILKVCTVK